MSDEKFEPMMPDAFTDITRQIAESLSDAGKVTSLLTQLQDGYAKLFADHNKINEQNDTVTKENAKLKEYNMELFMQHGQRLVEESKGKQTSMTKAEERASTIKVEDLFNESEE